MEFATIIGIVGMALLAFAFGLEEFTKHTKKEQRKYTLLNLVGSALLLYYAIVIYALPFIILNVIWVLVAFKSLFDE